MLTPCADRSMALATRQSTKWICSLSVRSSYCLFSVSCLILTAGVEWKSHRSFSEIWPPHTTTCGKSLDGGSGPCPGCFDLQMHDDVSPQLQLCWWATPQTEKRCIEWKWDLFRLTKLKKAKMSVRRWQLKILTRTAIMRLKTFFKSIKCIMPPFSTDYQQSAHEASWNLHPYQRPWKHPWICCSHAKGNGPEQWRGHHAALRWHCPWPQGLS